MAESFDVVVLGTGNAGMVVAGVAHAAGMSVAIVESWDVGGTCPLRGCVPKKVLVAAAQTLAAIDRASEHKISVGDVSLDWGALMARERTFVEGTPAAFIGSLESRGIELVRGPANFSGSHQIDVDGRILDAGKIVIATGSKPRPLAIDGAAHLITSDDILEMTALPDSMIFIGGGVIAMELGHVLQRAGCSVTILEAMPQLLPRMDPGAIAEIERESERIGMKILKSVDVKSIAADGNTLTVSFVHDGVEKSLSAARVANGTGRVPNIDGLDLEAGGVTYDGLRIEVDEYLRSVSNLDVYVAGDALSHTAQLSPVATYEGRLVGDNIVDGDSKIPEYIYMPSAVYTVPAVATVGLTEAEADAAGKDYEAKTNDLSSWMSGRTYAETVAWSKVLVENGTGKILGAHLAGHGAEEVIHIFAFAMRYGVPASDLSSTVYAYPTFMSDVKNLV